MTDYIAIIDNIYRDEPVLKELLLAHSSRVALKALESADNYQRRFGADALPVDREFLVEAAMLHDIGILLTDAPGIYCFGREPYICHGTLGARLLEKAGLPRHALVCERHTGSGLTVGDIKRQQLPLPLRDMTPQSIEEKLICYADKFFSKSGDPYREKQLDRVRASMARHGEDTLLRFDEMHAMFAPAQC